MNEEVGTFHKTDDPLQKVQCTNHVHVYKKRTRKIVLFYGLSPLLSLSSPPLVSCQAILLLRKSVFMDVRCYLWDLLEHSQSSLPFSVVYVHTHTHNTYTQWCVGFWRLLDRPSCQDWYLPWLLVILKKSENALRTFQITDAKSLKFKP